MKNAVADTQEEKRNIAYVHCHAEQIELGKSLHYLFPHGVQSIRKRYCYFLNCGIRIKYITHPQDETDGRLLSLMWRMSCPSQANTNLQQLLKTNRSFREVETMDSCKTNVSTTIAVPNLICKLVLLIAGYSYM